VSDAFLDGAITLRQPARGFRAGTDSVLLGAAVRAGRGERVFEPGCGAGAALLIAAHRNPEAVFAGLEQDGGTAALAAENAAENGLGERVVIHEGDIAAPPDAVREALFDQVFLNPPFFDPEGGWRPPREDKRAAHWEGAPLGGWLDFALRRLKPKGRITLIHRTERLPDILAVFAGRAGSVRVKPVVSRPGRAAGRALVTAVKRGRSPFTLLSPLVMHGAEGKAFSAEGEAILRGRAGIDWED